MLASSKVGNVTNSQGGGVIPIIVHVVPAVVLIGGGIDVLQ